MKYGRSDSIETRIKVRVEVFAHKADVNARVGYEKGGLQKM